MKWVINYIKNKIEARKYKTYKHELDKYKMELDQAGVDSIRKKMNSFVDGLTPAELVFLSSFDLDKTFGELAFYQLMNRDNKFRKTFQRQEVEALGAYYVEAYMAKDVKKNFALTTHKWNKLKKRFQEYCANIYTKEETVNE